MKDIKGFEGLYAITKEGQVWSYPKKSRTVRHHGKWLKLRGSGKERGGKKRTYKTISIKKDGKYFYFYIHRLVAETFIKNPNNFPIVNHKNGDGSDNFVENLEWCTQKQNCLNTVRLGRSTKGIKNPMAKLNESQINKMRREYADGNISHKNLGKKYDVSGTDVGLIIRRKIWTHI